MFSFSLFTAVATLILIMAGGLVTSTGSGLSVPDWPLSYGTLNPPMIGGIRFEHTHRLIAGSVGILTMILAVVIWRGERRTWLKRLVLAACLAVLLQALLGGLTVLYYLPAPVSIAHACLGQTFFSLLCVITYGLSREWRQGDRTPSSQALIFSRLSGATAFFAYAQLVAGAIVRHTHGRTIAWHLLIGSVVVIHTLFLTGQIFSHRELKRRFLPQILLALSLLCLQVFLGLGAYMLKYAAEKGVVPRGEEVLFATAHQTVGAIILANFILLALRGRRFLVQDPPAPSTADYLDLMKLRVTLASLITTFASFLLSSGHKIDILILFHTLLSAFLLGGGANTFNQIHESDADARMARTQNRPIPGGRLSHQQAALYGWLITLAGLSELYFFVSKTAFWVGLAIFVSYVYIYTPLKRLTELNTFAGAVPGALPSVLGWVAAGGPLDVRALCLFSVVFIWQIPHFYAIAWMYRKDYADGGFKMFPLNDPSGRSTARQIVVYTILLTFATTLPAILGMAGRYYLAASMVICAILLYQSARCAFTQLRTARRYVLASVLYILVIFLALVLDKR